MQRQFAVELPVTGSCWGQALLHWRDFTCVEILQGGTSHTTAPSLSRKDAAIVWHPTVGLLPQAFSSGCVWYGQMVYTSQPALALPTEWHFKVLPAPFMLNIDLKCILSQNTSSCSVRELLIKTKFPNYSHNRGTNSWEPELYRHISL